MLAVGADVAEFGYWIAATVIEPVPDPQAAKAQAKAYIIESIWARPEPLPAPGLEAALDALAGRVARGETTMKKAFKDLGKLNKAGKLVGGAMSMLAVAAAPNEAADMSGVKQAPGAKYLAIGQGIGDFGSGNGLQQTVLIVVTASEAK